MCVCVFVCVWDRSFVAAFSRCSGLWSSQEPRLGSVCYELSGYWGSSKWPSESLMSRVPCLSFCLTLCPFELLQCLEALSIVNVLFSHFQVLGVSEEPGGVFVELHEIHYQFTLPPFPLHCGLCSAGHAAFWRTVSITLQYT